MASDRLRSWWVFGALWEFCHALNVVGYRLRLPALRRWSVAVNDRCGGRCWDGK